MRILIDMQGDQTGSHYRGIGRFIRELVRALIRQYPQHQFILHFDRALPASVCRWRENWLTSAPNVEISTWQSPEGIDRDTLSKMPWRPIVEQLYVRGIERAQADLLFVPSLFELDVVVNLSRLDRSIRRVVLMHDLIPLVRSKEYLDPYPDAKAGYLRRLEELDHADHLICNSAFTATEAIEMRGIAPELTTPVWADADDRFRPHKANDPEIAASLDTLGVENGFVLYTGATDPRKNVDLLIEAFGRLSVELQRRRLVLAGPINETQRMALEVSARRHGLPSGTLVVLGHVTDGQLVALYNACSAFVFPSKHEGFGLPTLEAMRCGAPVLAARATSLIEVVGDEAALFDPDDAHDLAARLERLLSDESWRAERLSRARIQAEQFSWDRTAGLAMAVFEHEVNPHHTFDSYQLKHEKAALGKPTLAFVSPLPPAHTGIANYSDELLPVLAQHYAVTLVTDQAKVSPELVARMGETMSPDQFRAKAGGFDRVLYQVGNSPFHTFMVDLLDAVPGVMVMHDCFVGGMWLDAEAAIQTPIDATGRGPVWAQAVRVAHGWDGLAQALAMDRSSFIDRFQASWPLIERSLGVIVHSQHAIACVETAYPGAPTGDWTVIPHLRALPDAPDRDAARRRLGIDPDDFIVTTIGMVSPTKRNEALLDAWAQSALIQEKNCYLVLAGPMDHGDYGQRLRDKAAGMPHDVVILTDRLSDEAFSDWLAASDMAVQLRGESRGESSGAVAHAMAHALPVIVNAHGSMAELPADTVCRIRDPVDPAVLAEALEKLYTDKGYRDHLGAAARDHIAQATDPAACADQYVRAIERYYANVTPSAARFVDGLDSASVSALGEAGQRALARAITGTLPDLHPVHRLFVDVTATAATERVTGVERVVQRLVESWLEAPPEGFRIEPVRLVEHNGHWQYRTAAEWMRRVCRSDLAGLGDEAVDPRCGDVLGIVDISGETLVDAVDSGLHQRLRAAGCRIFAVCHDTLPVTHPHCFPPGADKTHQRWMEAVSTFDAIFGTSKAVRDTVRGWLVENQPERVGVIKTGHFALGTDHIATSEMGDEPPPSLDLPTDRCLFITVGTIEPRKRHQQVMDAFEHRWAAGSTDCLVIVGKEGWQELPDRQRRDIPETVKRLSGHPERGQRLFWLDGLSDSELDALYHQANGLIAASEDEGYGLPLVEAGARGLPVLARDIPVFREVAPAQTCFFQGFTGDALATALDDWVPQRERDEHPGQSEASVSWRESARQLWAQIHP